MYFLFQLWFYLYMINVYSDSSQTALKYLKDTEANINNILIMTGDFNIRNSIWDLNFLYHSMHSNLLTDIVDSMNSCLSRPANPVSSRYLDNRNNSNLVIDLMFLRQDLLEFNNHIIYPDWRLSSDHASLTVSITIIEEHIQTRKHTLVKNSKEEEEFIKELTKVITKLNTENISDEEMLEQTLQIFANNINRLWFKYSKVVNITKHLKVWWNNDYHRDLRKYRISK